ncbi:MAG: hypothetical protein OSA83_00010 [Pseudomonadales bacterium]|nr:hypothetical protein [Pseudomonadales bacterium]
MAEEDVLVAAEQIIDYWDDIRDFEGFWETQNALVSMNRLMEIREENKS